MNNGAQTTKTPATKGKVQSQMAPNKNKEQEKGGNKETSLAFIMMVYVLSKVGASDGEIAERIKGIFPMRPYDIEQRFALRTPIYTESAAYGHMGRTCEVVTKAFKAADGSMVERQVKLFPWEELDCVDALKAEFGC